MALAASIVFQKSLGALSVVHRVQSGTPLALSPVCFQRQKAGYNCSVERTRQTLSSSLGKSIKRSRAFPPSSPKPSSARQYSTSLQAKTRGSNFGRSMAASASAVPGPSGVADQEGLAPDSFALGTFEFEGRATAGYIQGGHVWPLEEALPGHSNLDVLQVIRDWANLQKSIRKPSSPGTPLASIKLLTPLRVVRPPMCVGKNYQEHVKEVDSWKGPGITQPSAPTTPIIFTKAAESVIGPGEAIQYPHGVSSEVDYEAELAVVIGTGGRGISREDALGHVFGYTILNDVTARDLQRNHQQWFLGKSVDTFCPIGPWIVPASQIDGQNLGIKCWVNEELRQESRTSEMIFDIRELIHTISTAVTLQPGDVIATGTPAGVGSGFKPPRWLMSGNSVTIWVEGIGKLQNPVK